MSHANVSLPRILRALVLMGGLSVSLIGLQACISNPSDTDDQKEQARLKDKSTKNVAPKDTDRVCAAVLVCGADGKTYSSPCAAADAGVEYGMDMGKCGGGSIDPIAPIGPDLPWCGNDPRIDTVGTVDPGLPIEDRPGLNPPSDPIGCVQVILCDDNGKNCHSPCDLK
jgi:hypothetical protein